MSTPAIKTQLIPIIKADENLKLKLAKANGVKMTSVDRWLRQGTEPLTTFRSLEILKQHFGVLEVKELLEEAFLQAS